jgi:hypothetical protein
MMKRPNPQKFFRPPKTPPHFQKPLIFLAQGEISEDPVIIIGGWKVLSTQLRLGFYFFAGTLAGSILHLFEGSRQNPMNHKGMERILLTLFALPPLKQKILFNLFENLFPWNPILLCLLGGIDRDKTATSISLVGDGVFHFWEFLCLSGLRGIRYPSR